ncbi:MAG: DNA primase, partial [Candidatus Omnitrophota bacterium]
MFFPQEIIKEIQERADIVEVISNYFPLKKAGSLFKTLCPFHQEKTPSFIVNPQKQIFHCFGCGVGGNVFSFLMRQENISFPEAVEMLARQTGVNISRYFSKSGERSGVVSRLYEVNELSSLYYQNNLLNKEKGREARRYLLERRGISQEVISRFRIGYAPAQGGLLSYLQKRGWTEEILIQAGLAVKREEGIYTDKFLQKIIFPLFNPQGKIVGFGSRRLDNQVPKYVNSPQTVVFNKSRYLYGLNFAKQFIKESVIIVEGYLDLLSLVQYGICNVVASLGTALTREQIRLLKRYTQRCLLIYDGDKAGQDACLRGLDLFIEEGIEGGVVLLPEGLDPDSCIREEG